MFIHPSNTQTVVRKAGLVGISRKQAIADREQRRYQYLFQSEPLHNNKSFFRHVVTMVNQFLSQIMGRDEASQKQLQTEDNCLTGVRQVRGIADRVVGRVDPDNPKPEHDSVFLGEAKDYPAPVLAIEYNNTIKPVFYEGNQVVARHLYLDGNDHSTPGRLILNDGSYLPIEIMVFTAV